jgi:transposase
VIEPFILVNQPGPKCNDDRQIISGIIPALKTGCRWCDCPPDRTIQNWVAEADRVEGRRAAKPPTANPGLTATERDELVRLRCENRQLKLVRRRDI